MKFQQKSILKCLYLRMYYLSLSLREGEVVVLVCSAW